MGEKTIGIIAEWNPFHRGHEKMVQYLKDCFGDAFLMAVMSGPFVQRGEPSLFDPWIRARWAVECGVDAVFSFPVLCVLQSADRFAAFGVELLSSMGADSICFGTESLEKEELLEAASFSLTDSYSRTFHEALAQGLSYATASYEAMKNCSTYLADELSRPNNLLGFRYTETILRNRFSMDILVFHRDTDHDISASAARKELLQKNRSGLLPISFQKEAEALMQSGNCTDYSRYEDACLLASRLWDEKSLAETGLFSEGLEHKWFRETGQESYGIMLDHIKSKRYLYSRLKRLGAQLLLSGQGPSLFMHSSFPKYARLLSLRRKKSSALNHIAVPVYTSMAKAWKQADQDTRLSLEIDIRASDIRAFCQKSLRFRKSRQEFYHSPEIVG
ncbi:nucleotidyltransferase family protein [Dialister sp.]|uniref:nucleotidyltransferase family protein n=1 Tax=Dialister sp. TaxID=1955814 RepID=UPI003EFFF9AB